MLNHCSDDVVYCFICYQKVTNFHFCCLQYIHLIVSGVFSTFKVLVCHNLGGLTPNVLYKMIMLKSIAQSDWYLHGSDHTLF